MVFIFPSEDGLAIANPVCVLTDENFEELTLQCRRRVKLDRTFWKA
jgi:hypothetical protein